MNFTGAVILGAIWAILAVAVNIFANWLKRRLEREIK